MRYYDFIDFIYFCDSNYDFIYFIAPRAKQILIFMSI